MLTEGPAEEVKPAEDQLEPGELVERVRQALGRLKGEKRRRAILKLAHAHTRGECQLIAVAIFELTMAELERKVREQLAGQPEALVEGILAGRRKEWRTTGLEVCCVCAGERRIGGQELTAMYTCGTSLPCTRAWRLLRPVNTTLRTGPVRRRPRQPRQPRLTTSQVTPRLTLPARPPPPTVANRKQPAGMFDRARPGRCSWCRHEPHAGRCSMKHGRGVCMCPSGGSARL